MALPNYTPSGTIRFGSVPWDDSYANVRLYGDLQTQLSDISSLMTISSDSYVYIGRNRRLKVSIEADRLYHCNYCMYRNESVTDGYIYCFVKDVRYVNDHTSEVLLETDVFQTYLYSVDWTVPPCFIERETTPSEQEAYMLTSEPDFPLVYTVDAQNDVHFKAGGYVVMTSGDPESNSNLVEDIINPSGYYAKPAPVQPYKGVPNGCAVYYCPIINASTGYSEHLEQLLNELTYAGSVDSIAAIFTIPDFATSYVSGGFQPGSANGVQDATSTVQASYGAPDRGTSLDGYTPRNKKLLYYPYTYLNLTDYNGSASQLRYELMRTNTIALKYVVGPACQAMVIPDYMGIRNYDAGLVIGCGAMGSWSNNAFQTWLGQNGASIALTIAGAALAGAAGATTIAGASAALSAGAGAAEAASATALMQTGEQALLSSGSTLLGAGAQASNASHQPTVTRGQVNFDTMFGSGVQGFAMQKVCLVSEVAQQVDEFFDRFGYAVERIQAANITSRKTWNYIKTGGCSPKSLNGAAGTSAPFTRGRGTPAEALDVIRRAFDGGVTFWHTTGGFGDYSLDNTL